MKQTAVEWIAEQLIEGTMRPVEIIAIAKEMEKEQIIKAYLKNHRQGCWMDKSADEFAEQYYNETFKSV